MSTLLPSPSTTLSPPSSPIIRLCDVCKTYRSAAVEVHAVRGVMLDIYRGDFVAIMGASGSGKSSLMNMLGCLDRPNSGEYSLDGVNISSLSRSQLATLRNHKLGFVFQSFHLLSRTTALENVELPMFYSQPLVSMATQRKRAEAVLAKVGLAGRGDHWPNQLSGGQQQRVAIARALVNQPQMVLADEPTGNLDSRTSIEIMGLFEELNNSGITIVMVTHELEIAAYCKRIIVMRDGKVLSDTLNENRRSASRERHQLDEAERHAQLG
ncbi:MAG TPA: ABC transporter ATP-binding protein [Candidatus Methylacidiphilales bacterium]|nr:ABC transporter ATP-binding protein [Candidatus Methylacidiphilales bacterium]